MLVLTRKIGETIELTGGIVITVRHSTQSSVVMTIAAPPTIKIVRGELAAKVLDNSTPLPVGSGKSGVIPGVPAQVE
jgi:carbon storage regulator CsrA